jgi:hypothetical protein
MPNSHWKVVDTQRGMLTPEGVSYRRSGADMKAGTIFKNKTWPLGFLRKV